MRPASKGRQRARSREADDPGADHRRFDLVHSSPLAPVIADA